MSRLGVVAAFGYIKGHLYFGHNHLQISSKAFEDGHIDASVLPTREYLDQQGPMAFGWIWQDSDGNKEAEFYSDFMQADQHFEIFDKVFKMIQKKYPDCTEMTMGPDPETISQMSEVFK